MRGIPFKLASLAMTACLNYTAYAQLSGEVLLSRAAQCLVAKGFLPRREHSKRTFGYFLDDKSYAGKTIIYVVNYPSNVRRDGFVFTVFLSKRDGTQVFNIQNNARFMLSKSETNVSFTSPPLGGTWTSEHLVSAIKRIQKEPKTVISAKDLLMINPSIKCEAYTDK